MSRRRQTAGIEQVATCTAGERAYRLLAALVAQATALTPRRSTMSPDSPNAHENDSFDGPGRCRVLLVDDHPNALAPLQALLFADGYEVTCARSAEEAITTFHKEAAHIVVTDLIMPGKSGIELTKVVKER